MIETSGYTNMKKKFLSLLLLPLALTSCGSSPVSLDQMKEKLANVSDEAKYPYYKVVGSIDFNNQVLEVDAEFSNEPGYVTFVPYSRYNDGFYNATADTSEANIDDIIIFSGDITLHIQHVSEILKRLRNAGLYAKLEKDLLKEINKMKIGPQGLGGDISALGVFIEQAPCHTASLPVAVNISCHVSRHITEVL